MKIFKSVFELIGKTPLLEAVGFKNKNDLKADIFLKLEYFNPAGSVKDRVGYYMIKKAEEEGKIKEGCVIIEPTSGNTGIGIASVAASKGYKVILTMPETMSIERRKLLSAYGAEIVLTPGKDGMQGAIDKAEELNREIENSFICSQFDNPYNPEIHYLTTGPEIWEDTDGEIDIFVAGVGTGGTLSGVGKYLKEKNKDIKVIAVEPTGSAVLSGKEKGTHGLQGIGAGFVPKNLDTKIYDEIITVNEEDAYLMSKTLARSEGILVGVSSGAALAAACELAKRKENEGKKIVVLLPDTGERYLSTPMFD